MGKLTILDRTGDSEVSWNPGDAQSAKEAAIRFKEMTDDKGYLAFRADKEGNGTAPIKEFDPEAEEILMLPRMVGG